ncbi:MAG: hypothetical protein KY392_06355, partial [Chloroflexi bacterium]|nr:hypothetical protein [Chloroflexota bacterium]
MFELRRDPVTGWWSAIVADRAFERAAFEIPAQPIEGTHCRHCDEAPENEAPHHVRRIPLRSDAFHRIDSSKRHAAQLSLSEVERATGSWEILVGPRDHHERLADAAPQLAGALMRSARDAMRAIAAGPRDLDPEGRPEPLYIQLVQSYGRQAGSRSGHLNLELYAMPQVPHLVAEEIGGGARQIQRGGDAIGHEVERGAALHHQRLPLVVREHEHRCVVRRILAPPAPPGWVPIAAPGTEHVAAHDVGGRLR